MQKSFFEKSNGLALRAHAIMADLAGMAVGGSSVIANIIAWALKAKPFDFSKKTLLHHIPTHKTKILEKSQPCSVLASRCEIQLCDFMSGCLGISSQNFKA